MDDRTTDEPDPTPRRRSPWAWLRWFDPERRPGFWPQQWELTRRTLHLFAAEFVLVAASLALLPIRVGNEGAEELSREDFVLLAVVIPIVEELVFRWLPNALVSLVVWIHSPTARNRPRGEPRPMRWWLGIPVAVGFALLHNLTDDPAVTGLELAPGQTLSFESLPLPQLALGLFLWNVVRRFGLRQAIFCHALHNAIAVGLGTLGGD